MRRDPQQCAHGDGSSAVRIVIADDLGSTRRYLRAVIEECPELEVAGEAADGAAAVALAEALQPDVVLLDISMPILDGADALAAVMRVAPGAQVVLLSGMEAEVVQPLLAAGASGFVPKGVPPTELIGRLGDILGRDLTKAPRPGRERRAGRRPIGAPSP